MPGQLEWNTRIEGGRSLRQRLGGASATSVLVLIAMLLGGMALGNYLTVRSAADCAVPKTDVIEPRWPAVSKENVTAQNTPDAQGITRHSAGS